MYNHNHRITLHQLQYAILQICQHDDHLPLSTSACVQKSRDMQILKVAGDHRVAIFAKERIEACAEIFYDYGYAGDQAHGWVLKPDDKKKCP